MTVDPADFYTGLVSEVYSSLRSETFEPGPYAEFIAAHGEPALEIGCGDGDPILALRQQGLEVEGVDSSHDMLDRCRQAAARLGVTVVLYHQRMEDLALPRQYRSIYLAGPTFTLLATDVDAQRALAAIRAHLTPDGVALVPLWIPPPTSPEELGRPRTSRTADAEMRFTALSEEYDENARIRRTRTRYEVERGGECEVLERDWVIHWFGPDLFEEMAAAAGLRVVGFDQAAPDEFSYQLQRRIG